MLQLEHDNDTGTGSLISWLEDTSVGLLEYKAQLFARQTTDYLISTHLEYKAR